MSAPRDRLDIKEVLSEKDAFKLAIRGNAAIEEAIDAAIAEGFGGSTPPELSKAAVQDAAGADDSADTVARIVYETSGLIGSASARLRPRPPE